jgi:HK97 family phage portal protein
MRSLGRAIQDAMSRTPQSPIPRGTSISGLPIGAQPGTETFMRAMGSVGTLYAIVRRNSESASQVRWHLYKSNDDPDEEREEVKSHLALTVWNKPNKFYTRQSFVETIQQHLELTGETYWVVSRAGGKTGPPVELWPVRPDRMYPVPHKDNFLQGWQYLAATESVPLELEQVIQLKIPCPWDPYRGLGPVQSMLIDLESSRYAAEWNRNFFLNSAQPGGIVEIGRELSDKEWRKMRDRWEEQHKGVANAHRVALLEEGKWVDRKYTMQEMQFPELRALSSEMIRQAFTFPKPMLGTVEDVNRANAEAAEVVFARWLLVPRLERIREALNTMFLPMFGDSAKGLEFDYCSPVPEDKQTDALVLTAKANAAVALIGAGFEPDDVLDTVGLPNMKMAEKEPVPAPLAPFPPGQPAPDPNQDPDQVDTDAVAQALLQSVFNTASRERRQIEAVRRKWAGVG